MEGWEKDKKRPNEVVRPPLTRKRRAKDLLSRPKAELVDIILRLEARFSRLESEIDQLETQVLTTPSAYAPNLASLTFNPKARVDRYERLPVKPVHDNENIDETTWRFILVSSNPKHRLLGLEIYDDVVVGRAALGSKLGIDLTPYGAEVMGVSRRHAMFRPGKYSLFLIDLGSKNGTFCNAVRLGPGTAHRLTENDVITFSKLHFRVQMVSRPEVNVPGLA